MVGDWRRTGGGLAMFEMQVRTLLANECTPCISGEFNRFVMPWLDHGIHSVAVVAETDANCRTSCFGCALERHGCHDQVMAGRRNDGARRVSQSAPRLAAFRHPCSVTVLRALSTNTLAAEDRG